MSTVENGKGCDSQCCAITVFSYLFHFFRLKEQQWHVGQINLIPSKTPLTKVTFWRNKWIPLNFHLSSPLKSFFYPTSLLRLCFLVLCTTKFQNSPCPPTPEHLNFLKNSPGMLAVYMVKCPTSQPLVSNPPPTSIYSKIFPFVKPFIQHKCNYCNYPTIVLNTTVIS